MLSALCSLNDGATLHTGSGRSWLDTGFQAVLHHATFIGLLRRGLLRPVAKHKWALSRKGRKFLREQWRNR